jgi:hypothetical protein
MTLKAYLEKLLRKFVKMGKGDRGKNGIFTFSNAACYFKKVPQCRTSFIAIIFCILYIPIAIFLIVVL